VREVPGLLREQRLAGGEESNAVMAGGNDKLAWKLARKEQQWKIKSNQSRKF
jgi:hypothetical protein